MGNTIGSRRYVSVVFEGRIWYEVVKPISCKWLAETWLGDDIVDDSDDD